jgi:hypothetical protein
MMDWRRADAAFISAREFFGPQMAHAPQSLSLVQELITWSCPSVERRDLVGLRNNIFHEHKKGKKSQKLW